jgi:hypothetical protein
MGDNATLMQRNRELEEDARKLKDFQSDFANYAVYQTRSGGICYRPKPGMPEAKLAVYVCANCKSDGVKTYLQPKGSFWLPCSASPRPPVCHSRSLSHNGVLQAFAMFHLS